MMNNVKKPEPIRRAWVQVFRTQVREIMICKKTLLSCVPWWDRFNTAWNRHTLHTHTGRSGSPADYPKMDHTALEEGVDSPIRG